MGPRRAWSRRQSWVNPCPVTGDSGVLTVQATALRPTYPRGVTHFRLCSNAHRFRGRSEAQHGLWMAVVPRHKNKLVSKPSVLAVCTITCTNTLYKLEASKLLTKLLLDFYTPLLGA